MFTIFFTIVKGNERHRKFDNQCLIYKHTYFVIMFRVLTFGSMFGLFYFYVPLDLNNRILETFGSVQYSSESSLSS